MNLIKDFKAVLLLGLMASMMGIAQGKSQMNLPSRQVIHTESVYQLKPNHDLDTILFPITAPLTEHYLKVSELHEIWIAEYGNPKGIPMLVVHGGPGAGVSPNESRYADPKKYRMIVFDQRGAGNSRPFGEMKENSTQDSINDIEKIRKYLKIDKWVLFGGSWGSTLSLAYGQAHPESCLGFILRGVFLASEQATQNLWVGMKDMYPDAWDDMVSFLPPNERSNIELGYYHLLMNSDKKISVPAAHAFMKYDLICSTLLNNPLLESKLNNDDFILGIARTFTHYSVNQFFLKPNQLLTDVGKINHLPAIIVQGRYDVICRPEMAYDLHKLWPKSKLVFVNDAGHSALEPGIAKELVSATNEFFTKLGAL
jgi:proline iminopeptidase